MGRLADITAQQQVQDYAQGLVQQFTSKVADFLAPTVNVSSVTGRYAIYNEKHRFKIPNTAREPGARAVQITMGASAGTFNCKHNALDAPVDILEQAAADGWSENMLAEAGQMCAEVAGLAHENSVISAAVTQLTGGAVTLDFATTTQDVVNDIDTQIEAVVKSAGGGGGIMNVGVLFGITAARKFKNHATVRARFINNAGRGSVPSPTFEEAAGLLLGRPSVMMSSCIQDTAVEGVAQSLSYLLANKIIVFVRSPSPTRRDPSFMKTFRLNGKWMVPGSYIREDGRGEVAKFDWSEDVKITNSTAAVMLNGN